MIYSYHCSSCSADFEELYFTLKKVEQEEPELKCPKCGSLDKKRTFTGAPQLVFVGSGWSQRTESRSYDATSGIKDHIKDLSDQKKSAKRSEAYDMKAIDGK